MSSLLRRQQRKFKRRSKTHIPQERPFRVHKTGREELGGYDVLTPTKGWKRVSAARLRAQARLRHIIETVDRRMGRI